MVSTDGVDRPPHHHRSPEDPSLAPGVQPAAIAGHLLGEGPGAVAFLLAGARLLYARHTATTWQPSSAVVRLLQGIWGREPPETACRTVRARIYTTAADSSLDRATVRVAGKRLTAGVVPQPVPDLPLPAEPLDVGPWAPDLQPCPGGPARAAPPRVPVDEDRAWLGLARELAQTVPRGVSRFAADRAVAALLVGPAGELLGQATNRGGTNRTLHAEVNLVQEYYLRTGSRLPVGCRVYTTLKPCKMCAALLAAAATDPGSLTVVYAQHDPGPAARATLLDPPPGPGAHLPGPRLRHLPEP